MKKVSCFIDYISNIRTIHEPFPNFLNIITQNHIKISWPLGLKLKYQSKFSVSSSTEDDIDFEYDKVVSELQKQVLSELFHTHILQKL